MRFLLQRGTYSSDESERKLNDSFAKIREEFDEHLQAINENTMEISQNHEYLCRIESRVDKVFERLDHLELFLRELGYSHSTVGGYHLQPLTTEEKRVFVALYAIEESKGHVTYADIAKGIPMDLQLVAGYVASLMEKGIPIVKRYVNNIAYLRLDQDFKRLQAKENIVGIDKAQRQLAHF